MFCAGFAAGGTDACQVGGASNGLFFLVLVDNDEGAGFEMQVLAMSKTHHWVLKENPELHRAGPTQLNKPVLVGIRIL